MVVWLSVIMELFLSEAQHFYKSKHKQLIIPYFLCFQAVS